MTDGVLVIDKPAGMTSFDVIARLRKQYGQKKFGHTGTLDPEATGVLVILAGKAAKALPYLTNTIKPMKRKLNWAASPIPKTSGETPSRKSRSAAILILARSWRVSKESRPRKFP